MEQSCSTLPPKWLYRSLIIDFILRLLYSLLRFTSWVKENIMTPWEWNKKIQIIQCRKNNTKEVTNKLKSGNIYRKKEHCIYVNFKTKNKNKKAANRIECVENKIKETVYKYKNLLLSFLSLISFHIIIIFSITITSPFNYSSSFSIYNHFHSRIT